MIRSGVQTTNICFFTMIIFVIGDLYFAYNDYSCTNLWVTNTKIGFGLGTWLKVSGYTNLLFLIFPAIRYILAGCSTTLVLIYMVCISIYVFFRFIWLVIGGIMFWGYLWGLGLCSQRLNIYMWINLIYSFFLLFFLCHSQQQVYSNTYGNRAVVI